MSKSRQKISNTSLQDSLTILARIIASDLLLEKEQNDDDLPYLETDTTKKQ